MERLELVRHIPSGEVYVRSATGVCGPLSYRDWQDADSQEPRADWAEQEFDFDFSTEEAAWAYGQEWQTLATTQLTPSAAPPESQSGGAALDVS